MIVSEGLAEVFAAKMYGEDKVGKWVRETSPEILCKKVKPLIRDNLMINDFNLLSSYLYGDEIMALRGGQAIGMPYCGGYACGRFLEIKISNGLSIAKKNPNNRVIGLDKSEAMLNKARINLCKSI